MDMTFTQSFDARDWARAFMDIVVRGGVTIDEGLMVGWFANAIMRGWDEHARRVDSGLDETVNGTVA